MKISLVERSKYFKGLLLLLGKDNKITEDETDLLLKVCDTMGFDKSFCRNAIRTLLENEYIIDDIPVFSEDEIVKSFLKDGFNIAYADNDLDSRELKFLSDVAKLNGIDDEWFNNLYEQHLNNFREKNKEVGLEVVNLI